MSELSSLQTTIGYQFSDTSQLDLAVTHKSFGKPHNERFEFLGDSVLGYLIAELIFERFPQSGEGFLTRLRASLVNGETLADMAREIDLGAHLKLGQGEVSSGGRDRNSILANAFEALIASIYIDSDMATCKHVVTFLYRSRLDATTSEAQTKDAKTRLQEALQERRLALPIYTVTKELGSAQEKTFEIQCEITDLQLSSKAQGKNKKAAQQLAAKKLLHHFEN